ncbi:hypothetical protein Tco_0593328 [Tanacetum coccineum]
METQKPLIKEQIVKIVDEHLYKIQDWNIEYLTSSKALNTGLQYVLVQESQLMLLGINLLLLRKVNAARHKLTTAVERKAAYA